MNEIIERLKQLHAPNEADQEHAEWIAEYDAEIERIARLEAPDDSFPMLRSVK